MQTLGLSSTTPKTENRLKALFWPSVHTGADVDYLGAQGYWVCALVAILSFISSIFIGHPISGLFVLIFYYLGGVGVREHSRYAAAVVLIMFVADSVLSMNSFVLRTLLTALLLSNLRATWIASRWKPASDEAILPPRLSDTWSDKFADQLPLWLWPKLRIPYYVFSAGFLFFLALGILMLLRHHRL
jgi:hypothetical protein